MKRPLDSIRIGERHRKDMGDIDGLARSIADVGLLHPIVITTRTAPSSPASADSVPPGNSAGPRSLSPSST